MYKPYLVFLALAATVLVATPATACGEGQFNAGQGLPFQSLLAPRPATVLIYANPNPGVSDSKRDALYAGLQRAGHRLAFAADPTALATALREKHFDVVITSFDAIDAVATATADAGNRAGTTALIPVMARGDGNAAQLHSRFAAYLTDGSSLGQYLKMIGKALPAPSL